MRKTVTHAKIDSLDQYEPVVVGAKVSVSLEALVRCTSMPGESDIPFAAMLNPKPMV
jgi:hypothetical protein